jgi:outer membrane receptor protein involved in Fe transport
MFYHKKASKVLVLVAFMIVFTAVQMFGQAVDGTLLGSLTDVSGAVVAGATVTATEAGTGIARSTQSNASGNYTFSNLPPGNYGVRAEAPGFKKESRQQLRVEVNSTVRVDMTMQPGAVTETVEVTGAAPQLQTERADVSQKIETAQLEQLPIGGANRNFQGLLALVPGTVRPHRDHSEFFNAQDTLSTEVNGQSREFNQLAIEGVNDDERTGLLQIYVPPAEAIQTVDVTTSNYSAEFGRAGGAVTNVILKSGTNSFHGSVYEYNRVSALQARSYFQRTGSLARTTFNYYGATFGGPIFKDKTFFFVDILRISDIRGQFNQLTVPTDAFRSGDMRAGGTNIYDPQTGNPNGSGRQQFSFQGNANVIDPARISPIALRLLALVPHANLPGLTNNYTQNTQLRKTPNSFDVKLDHNLRASDRIAFRFSRAVQNVYQQPIFGLAGGPANSAFQGTGIQHEQSGAINETHIFSPTLIMETRAGISHYRNIAQNADFGTKASDAVGIPGVNLSDFTSGLVGIRILGTNSDNPLVGYSASMPWDRGETNINIVNTWTNIHGNHTFKWGADIRRLRDDLVQAQTFSPRGRIDFGTGTTSLNGGPASGIANNFAGFLLDAPTEVGRDVSLTSGSWRETEAFFFGQDTWHATKKLTVDAGLRWELYIPTTPSAPGRYSNYDPTINRLVLAGIDGNPSNLGRETYYKYFAPRLGLAYRLTEQTVFRGGFGISYEPFTNNAYAFNFPIRQNQDSSQTNGFAIPTLNGQVASMANGFPTPVAVAVAPDGTVTPNPGESYNVVDKHFQQPYVESWNLAMQTVLPANFVFELAYIGNHGVKIPVQYDLNAATIPALNANGTVANSTCSVRPLCAQFGRTGSTNLLFKPTTSNYNSMQVKLDHKWANGFLLTTAYTWAKALAYRSDAGNDAGGPDNYIDFQRNYSEVSRSRRHTFVQSYIYELPFGRGKRYLQSGVASWIVGGWGVGGVLTRMSGLPLHITDNGNTLNAPGSTQYPNLVAPFKVLGGIDTSLWFDPTSFAHVTTPGVLGNLKRYEFHGPGFFNLDAALFRNFPIRERMGLELRAEAFSITNTPQFSLPNSSFTSTDFGKIKGVVGGNRVMELSAKFSF